MSNTTSTDHHARLEALAALHGERGWRVARTLMGNDADAADVLQQSFLVLAKDAERIPAGEPWPWFCKVVVHCALNARRVRGRRKSRIVDDPMDVEHRDPRAASPADEAARRELGLVLREALERLPESERDALTLTHLGGLTTEEAADALGMPQNTVKSHCKRGMEKLRARIGHRQGLRDDAGVAAAFAFMPISMPAAGLASMLSGAGSAAGALAGSSGPAGAATVGVGGTMGGSMIAKKIALVLSVFVGLPAAGLVSWWAYNEYKFAAMDKRCDAIEAKVRQFVPSGTTIEKFYNSLPDDGTAWAKIEGIGEAFDKLRERGRVPLGPTTHPDHDQSTTDSQFSRPLDYFFDRTIHHKHPIHEIELDVVASALPEVSPTLEALLKVEASGPIFMIPTRRERSPQFNETAGSQVAGVILAFRVANCVAVARALNGEIDESTRLLEHMSKLAFSLVPLSTVEQMVVALLRESAENTIVEMATAGFLNTEVLRRMERICCDNPMRMEFVIKGGILGLFQGNFPDGTEQSYARRWRSLLADKRYSQEEDSAERNLAGYEEMSKLLDPMHPCAGLYGPNPTNLRVEDLVFAQRLIDDTPNFAIEIALQQIFHEGIRSGRKALVFDSTLSIGSGFLTGTRTTSNESARYPDFGSLGKAGLELVQFNGHEITLATKAGATSNVTQPWNAVLSHKSSALAKVNKSYFLNKLTAPVPTNWLESNSLVLTDSVTKQQFVMTFESYRKPGSDDWIDVKGTQGLGGASRDFIGVETVITRLNLISDEHYLVALSFPKGKAAAPAEAGEGR